MKKRLNIPVLMYHGIEDEDTPAGYEDAGSLLYVLLKEQFNEQMQYLQDQGYHVVSLLDLADINNLPEKSVVITFDDGHRSDYTIALPILKKFGYTACFYITTKWLGSNNFLLPEHVSVLGREGMLIGSHGVTHTFFNDMSKEQAAEELRDSKKVLENLTSEPVTAFSAPGGRLSKATVNQALLLGYQSIATSTVRPCSSNDGLHSIPRIAIKKGTSIKEFSKIVSCNSSYYLKIVIKHNILVWAKKILGNSLYEALRSIAIGK